MALDGTMDIPGSSYDLISVGVLDDAGLITTFANRRGEVRTPEGEVLLIAPKIDGLYRLRVGPEVIDQHCNLVAEGVHQINYCLLMKL